MRRLFGFQFATDIVTRLSRSNLKGGLPRRVLIECFKQRSKRDDEVEDENERKKKKDKYDGACARCDQLCGNGNDGVASNREVKKKLFAWDKY